MSVLSYAEQRGIGVLILAGLLLLTGVAWLWITTHDRRDYQLDEPAPANPYMPRAGVGCCCAGCNDARALVDAGMHRIDRDYERLCANGDAA